MGLDESSAPHPANTATNMTAKTRVVLASLIIEIQRAIFIILSRQKSRLLVPFTFHWAAHTEEKYEYDTISNIITGYCNIHFARGGGAVNSNTLHLPTLPRVALPAEP